MNHHRPFAVNYILKLKSVLENPACSGVFEPENVKLFEESALKIPPLGICILVLNLPGEIQN